MGLHMYCIVPDAHTPPPGLAGVNGAAVEIVSAAGLGVWVSRHDAPPQPSLDGARAHNAVVLAAMNRAVTPVPVRFGQWLDSDAAVERVASDRDRWAGRLAAFAGRAEYGVTIADTLTEAARDVHNAPAETGTAYMQQLARRQAGAAQRRSAADRIAGEIAVRVESFVSETSVDLPASGGIVARIAHLVAWEDVDAYHGVISGIGGTDRHVRLHLSGPWPPYSFA